MTQAQERSDRETSQVRDLDAVAADLLERVPP
jgi:hypothetical protein